jgi:DNA invertase Pin-like site-specific DNA recombinase/DNA-binding transcriptional MerR regulator
MSPLPLINPVDPQPIDRCAWYLRVSTPKQKLEHQREHVARFCDQTSIIVPDEFRFEDKEKRHKSAKRHDFQRLLDAVSARRLDWIIICSFDRWGVADVDEFFEFRRLLLKNDVQLWSVVDQMNLTGLTEADYFRIVAMAIGATKYVEQMAEKNILKMIEMAKQGWAATGNAPYGTDLVCYPVNDLTRPLFRVIRTRYMRPHKFRIVHYTANSRVERDKAGLITASHLTVAKEEETERMPLRDKKATGYRFEPSVEAERLAAVRQMYELYDAGLGFTEISRRLWEQGHKHYDKEFMYHGVETILANPVYVGVPGWGKNGVGAYRILHGGGPVRIRRKATDTFVVRKKEEEFVRPLHPLFPPIVPAELWQRVHDRLQGRARSNPQFGKRRSRSRATHPLNGKLHCPDCDGPMVLGSSMPAAGKRGQKTRCFNCGTYRRFSRTKCHANTVGWDRLDAAVAELMEVVKGRIDRLASDPLKTLQEESWAKNCELTRAMETVFAATAGGPPEVVAELCRPCDPDVPILDQVVAIYNRMHAGQTGPLRVEYEDAERELRRIGDLLIEGVPSQTVRKQLNARMSELEGKKQAIGTRLTPLTLRVDSLREQLAAVRRTIEQSEKAAVAKVLDQFVEKAIPRFEVLEVGRSKSRRAILKSVEFFPKQTEAARNILPHAMELCGAHRGTGSSPRPERSRPGTSSSEPPC